MNCTKCNSEINDNMKFCPYCGEYIKESKKANSKRNIIIAIVTVIIIIIMYVYKNYFMTNSYNDKNSISSLVYSACGDYDTIYTHKDLKDQGIYQSKKDSYVYFVKKPENSYGEGHLYEMGYTNYELIEEFFPDGIYFYRISRVYGVPNELKIALEAYSENDLIERYGETLYKLVKKINEDYETNVELNIFYADYLSDIKTTYDKLFMYFVYSMDNATIPYGMGVERNGVPFYTELPTEIILKYLSDSNNFSRSAEQAMSENRYISATIKNAKKITYDSFIKELNNSFVDRR